MMKKRRWMWPIAFFLVLAASTGGYLAHQKDVEPGSFADAKTFRVNRGSLQQTVMATGVVRPVVGAEVEVGSRISGRLVRLPVKVGDSVEAGDLLAELDAAGLDAQVAQAEANLVLAQAERALAQTVFDRKQRLVDEEIIPRTDLDVAFRDLEVAAARTENARAGLRGAEINRGYSRIEAPIRGVIAEVTTREGETVAASFAAPTFVTIIDLERLEVQAYVDETDIGRIFVGQPATFTVDTYNDVEFEATVTAIEPNAEIQGSVVNYVAVLEFADQEGTILRPEMTAHVRLEAGRRDDVLIVPRNTLHRRDGRRYVNVRRDGEWQEQEVRTGWRTERGVEIVDGLAEGDTVQINPT